MYLFLLLLLGLLAWNVREPFTVSIEGDLTIPPIKDHIYTMIDTVQDYTTRPAYRSLMSVIPYKHHYRKFRRHLNKL
jgi:hypothetical protein